MTYRIEKINELISQQLSMIFLADFPGEIITINFIHTNPDLSESKIYLSVSSNHKSIYDELSAQAGEYRKILAEKLYLRKMPRLQFIRDEMQESVEKIEKILDKNERSP